MAIIDDIPGVRVEVIVEGSALQEHVDDDVEKSDRTITRYIKAVSDQVFAVSIELLPEFEFRGDCIGFDVYVDGVWIDGPLIRKDEYAYATLSEGRDTEDGKVKKFRFATFEPGDVPRNIAKIHCLTLRSE